MEAKECDECGKMFMPKYEWSTLCWSCWWASPKGQAYAKRKQEESNGWDRNKGGDYDPYGQQGGRANHEKQESSWSRWSREAEKERPAGDTRIDKNLLRKLLQLCHPDKHNNSELANSVTRELLEMKGKL